MSIPSDTRTYRVSGMIAKKTCCFGWHSISCPCESCLNADAVAAYFHPPFTDKILDFSGLDSHA